MDKQYQIKRAARLCHCILSAIKNNDDPIFYITRTGGWTEEHLKELEKNLYQIADEWRDNPTSPLPDSPHSSDQSDGGRRVGG